MKLTLRKAEVVIIRKLINDRLEELRQGDATPNQLRVLSLIDKRIMRQEVRERAAIAAMQGLISGTQTVNALIKSVNEDNITFYKQAAIESVTLADELI